MTETNLQTKGLKRNVIDKFYTKTSIVKECIKTIIENLQIKNDDLIIEPSAGNGAFIKEIKTLSKNTIFYDLEPENKEITKQDFLLLDENKLKNFKKIHIIGNPPFGRQASLAIKFIKKACKFVDSISFILPKSFKKESMKKFFSNNFHLIIEKDLDENAFLVNNIEYNVPCVFQIWEKKTFEREIIPILSPKNFIFVNKNQSPDISFRRVGVNAGKIETEILNKSSQSHYFIRFKNNKKIEDNLKSLQLIKFNFNNTVGPKSISKQELISEFNKFL